MISHPRLFAGFLTLLFSPLVFAQEIPQARPAQTQPAQTRPAQPAPVRQGISRVPLETNPALRPTTHPATTAKAKVLCTPQMPRSNEPVTIELYPTKSTSTAILEYQLVKPGQYITYLDEEYSKNWSPLPMTPAGDHFTITLPPQLQVHRTLVRYRFRLDGKILPEKKNLPGNFAYFCYDGIGSWKGAIEPNSADESRSRLVEYDPAVMNSVRPLIFIAKQKDVEDSTWYLQDRSDRRWFGTLVYNGKVFDHIFYRDRGAFFRYGLGKHSWKFYLDNDNPVTLTDNFGAPYAQPVETIDLGPCIQQTSAIGEQGMFETLSYKMFELAGVPSPRTAWLQLRIIDQPDEQGATQYDGDLWGLYLALENPDENFVKEHNLPKGNLFKMDQSYGLKRGDLKTKSPTLPSDNSDLIAFFSALDGAKPRGLIATLLSGSNQTKSQYYRENVDLPKYYSYRAIAESIQHWDINGPRNCFWFHDPLTNLWYVIPWDTALTWTNEKSPAGRDNFSQAFLDQPEYALEYHNRLREVRDLLFYPEEMSRLIDSFAAVVYTPKQPSFTDVDRALWDFNPVALDKRKAPRGKQGMYYKRQNIGDFPGMVNLMKKIRRRPRQMDRRHTS